VIGRSLRDTLAALLVVTPTLRPVGEFAAGAARAALYKAAQRDRLRTVRRGDTLLTTQEWIEAYRAQRHRRRDTP
jgi:hypothetical protein